MGKGSDDREKTCLFASGTSFVQIWTKLDMDYAPISSRDKEVCPWREKKEIEHSLVYQIV